MDNIKKAALAEGSYVAFTKGSCKGSAGGCAYRLYSPDGKMTGDHRQSKDTTSNIVEMCPVIDALKTTPQGASVLVFTSSDYVKGNFEKYLAGWIKGGFIKPDGTKVANQGWWEKIIAQTATRKVTFHKTKADSGDPDVKHVKTSAREAASKASERVTEEALRALREGRA
jgi:ribonuclease HI